MRYDLGIDGCVEGATAVGKLQHRDLADDE
jgi:hypothetical protein